MKNIPKSRFVGLKLLFKVVLCLFFWAAGRAQKPTLRKLDTWERSDIDTSGFDRLQHLDRDISSLDSCFRPIAGDYTVIRYLIRDHMILQSGPNTKEQSTVFVLILKLDGEGKITDGFYYNLNNPELSYCSLNRITVTNLHYKHGLKLKQLGFTVYHFSSLYECSEFTDHPIFDSHLNLKL